MSFFRCLPTLPSRLTCLVSEQVLYFHLSRSRIARTKELITVETDASFRPRL